MTRRAREALGADFLMGFSFAEQGRMEAGNCSGSMMTSALVFVNDDLLVLSQS